MNINVGKVVFPGWSSSLQLVREHGVDAAGHAAGVVKAPDLGARLDGAVRALSSFDHALTSARQLPVTWFVRGLGTYLTGYDAAKLAVELLVGSGLVPGARERVGRQELIAGREYLDTGVGVAREQQSRFGRALAGGWLSAAGEDTAVGAGMIARGTDTARALVDGVRTVQAAVRGKRPVDPQLITRLHGMYDQLDAELGSRIEAESTPTIAPFGPTAHRSDPGALALAQRVDALLAQTRQSAEQLVRDTPTTVPDAEVVA